MEKAVVTGGAGFIGSHVVELLLQEGFQVIAMDDLSNGNMDNVHLFEKNPHYRFLKVDLSRPFDEMPFQQADYVFHLAALADIVPSVENPLKYHEANVTATARVLNACRKRTEGRLQKFVYSASNSCYGIPDTYPTPEDAEIRPLYPYAFMKYLAEQYVLFFGKLYHFPVISLRYFNVFGTRARNNRTYGAVFKVFLSQKLHGKPLTIIGDGTQTRDFTYVTDIARANLRAARSAVQGEIMNIGTGKPQSINYLAQLIGGPTAHIPKRPGEPDSTHADITKARKLLGWEPQVSFEEGVKIMLENIEYWRNAPVWEPGSIAEATEAWFHYLSPQRETDEVKKGEEKKLRVEKGRRERIILKNELIESNRVLVAGGAGYVGSVLVPALLEKYPVTVLDTFWFWDSPEEYLRSLNLSPAALSKLRLVQGDIRNEEDVRRALENASQVIHLACISNDPSSELDAAFTHSVNYDGSIKVIDLAKAYGIQRFIYASSSSVYGIKSEPNVTEEMPLNPLTQYSQLKVEIEHYLLHRLDNTFRGVIVRPSTICGYSPRQRLDVVVNILTNLAVNKGMIKVFGGQQLRPNIHMKDMVRLYVLLLEAPLDVINTKIYNAGDENLSVMRIAELVREAVGKVAVEVVETDDLRSYHVCSEKIRRELGFQLQHSVHEAILELKLAFASGRIPSPEQERYFNVRRMKSIIAAGTAGGITGRYAGGNYV